MDDKKFRFKLKGKKKTDQVFALSLGVAGNFIAARFWPTDRQDNLMFFLNEDGGIEIGSTMFSPQQMFATGMNGRRVRIKSIVFEEVE